MYNYVELTPEQVQGYLERIGLGELTEEERHPSKELLDRLVQNHQTHIPFENQNPYRCIIPVSLDVQDLYRKIIVNRRGGYCFEMNGLFISLLRTLGFNAWSCLCRVVRGGTQIRSISHRGNIVELDGELHFCDVGFGGPMPFGALPMKDGLVRQIAGETFRAEDQKNGWWSLWRTRQGNRDDYDAGREPGEQIEIMFQEALADPSDFNYLNLAMYANPESYFRKACLANIRTDRGYRNITDLVYTEKTDGEVIRQELADDEERKEILREKFGIDLDSKATGRQDEAAATGKC